MLLMRSRKRLYCPLRPQILSFRIPDQVEYKLDPESSLYMDSRPFDRLRAVSLPNGLRRNDKSGALPVLRRATSTPFANPAIIAVVILPGI